MKYKRILLKLSGESLQGSQKYGLSPEVLQSYAEQIRAAAATGVQIGIVIGGGNIFRGLTGAKKGFDRVKGDQMGMLATIINSLALQSALEDNGVSNLYITTVGRGVDDMIDYVYDTFSKMVTSDEENPGTISEVKELDTASGTARYFSYAYSYQNDTENGGTETKYSQCLVCYIPANVKNSCVLVSVNVYPDSAEGFLSEDVLVAEAQKGIAVVNIDK